MSDFSVTKIDPNTGRVSFTTDINATNRLTGIRKLAQKCALLVLRSFNSDVFEPQSGGNYLSFIGRNIDPTKVGFLSSELTSNVKKVEAEIISDQQTLNLPDQERLSSMDVVNLDIIPEETRIEVQIRVISAAGTVFPVILDI